MISPPARSTYDRGEILVDGAVHALGVATGLAGTVVLAVSAIHDTPVKIAATSIYLGGLVTMLGLSAAYNLWPPSVVKSWLRRLDHAAIYLLIAATCTAFLLPLPGPCPTLLLGALWLVAFIGMALKLVWPRRFERAAMALYLTMGWSGLFAVGPLAHALTPLALALIVAGGGLYSAGVVFHIWDDLRFHNAIWHCFVLVAAACHYSAVLISLS